MSYKEQTVELPLGYLLHHSDDWTGLCSDLGLNPMLMRDGMAKSSDLQEVTVEQLQKYGVLPEPDDS